MTQTLQLHSTWRDLVRPATTGTSHQVAGELYKRQNLLAAGVDSSATQIMG